MTRSAKAAFCAAAALAAFAPALRATDYYVSVDGDDESDGLSAEYPFATLDKAIVTATAAGDTIHVAHGTYSTTTQWGPNLVANLVGEGATRDEVVIQSAGTDRTLRMAAGSWLENVTVVGIAVFTGNADKGGAIEMSGGTITNCVIRDGHASYASARSGGNLFMASGLVVDCEIRGGEAKSRGGNIDIEGGTVRDCIIADGQATAWGGNVYMKGSSAVVTNCVITGGRNTDTSASNAYGGNVRVENAGTIADCVIADGVSQKNGGNVFMDGGTISGCTITGGSALGTSWDQGGGNVFVNGAVKVSRCTVSGGTTTGTCGGIRCRNASGVVEDCLVFGNAGGLCMDYGSAYNCTVVANTGFGIHGYTGAYAKIQNCVMFGNEKEWSGTKASAADAILNMATGDTTGFGESAVSVSESDFADWAGGDYRPAAGSALVDAGAADPRSMEASATDLDGLPRLSGTVDIGCYEYQKPDMVVHIDAIEYSQAFAPATVTFGHSTDNSASPENVVFTYDFGDGSATESTNGLEIAHTYTVPGIYTVKITATNDCDEEEAEMVYDGYVRVASSTVYVTPGNAGAGTFPYDTPERGYGNLKTAVQNAIDGYTLLLGAGVHTTSDQVYVNKAISIRGLGATPEEVVVRNTNTSTNSYYYRVMDVADAGAFVENLTLENGRVKNTYGGNLSISAGVVSNCVVRGGLAVADGGNAAGGGVVMSGAGTLTHCIVSNNLVAGTSSYENYAGGAVFIENGKKTCRISNCLIAYNTYVPDEGDAKSGAAGVRFGGSNDNTALENCTIVANTVEGSLKDDSAGVYCTTWYGRLRNNIVAGNFETGKGACTSVKLDFTSGNNFTYHNNVTDGARIADSGSMSKNNVLVSAPAALFKDFAAADFRINPSSPAFNGGTLEGLAFLPAVDLAGEERVAFGKIDAGCYECQTLPATVLVVR
ncbi:MAG: PKD domain-containing protein [Kiritimatiellae bacterium]|nr:PKD domain-containing protein [Kiritimatiellia bacterium]